ncbi:MAG: LCP family protein [Lachnospiraceae bacterium]|nr:LCP family protein [Lachnospiraceae bacterium]
MVKDSKCAFRYLLWLLALVTTIVLYIYVVKTAMLPVGLLILMAVLFSGIYFLLLWLQKKKKRICLWVAIVSEIVILAVCIYGISVLHHTTKMIRDITEIVTETEAISAYVLKDEQSESLQDMANEEIGIVSGQSSEAVSSVLKKLQKDNNLSGTIHEYGDMFSAADALRQGEVAVLLMNDAYAGLISEIEGYEWFAQEVKILETSVETVQMEKESPSKENPAKNDWNKQKEDTEKPDDVADQTVGMENEINVPQSGIATETVTMELVEEPEFVDWDSLVSQDMTEVPEGAFVMYISGVDTWGSVSSKSRSDVNILAVVNTNTKKVLLVSTPRDYYVPLSVAKGQKDKLTHAGIYGIDCSVNTLEMLYGVDVQYYARLNFTGFVNIVDALGGVDVYSDASFTVGDAFAFSQGMNHMSGIEALAFARERYNVSGGDLSRGNHQMEVIKAVLNKCTSASILYNYADVMNSVSGSFATNMSREKMASLVRMQLSDMAQWSISSIGVGGSGARKTTYSIPGKTSYVMLPDVVSIQNAKTQITNVLSGN